MGALTLAGGVLSAWEAHSILRGLKTLGLRLEKQCRNAERLAEFFLDCPQVEKVIYPGLATDEQAEIVATNFAQTFSRRGSRRQIETPIRANLFTGL